MKYSSLCPLQDLTHLPLYESEEQGKNTPPTYLKTIFVGGKTEKLCSH